jgi:replication factor C subunit 3/5
MADAEMTDAPADAPSSSTAAMETDAPKSHKAKVREEQTAALPWVEKYRPKEMSDLVSHEQIIGTITKLIDAGKLPHLMLYGPPGTGKTSTILACAHKLYGKHFSSMVLELNASDDRGIDVVREQIKEFASTRQMFSSAPKLIVLDEADNMTNPAQFALRRVIEKFTRNARFCIICNYASKIIPALQSRCTRFRFAPLSKEQAMSRIEVVAQAEGCRLAPGGLDACVALGCGDMRRCLNILQSTHMAFDEVSPDNVYQCTGAPRPADVEQMMGWLMGEDFTSAFNNMWGLMSERGLALQDVLADLFKHVMCIEQKGTAMPLARLVASLADVEHRLAVGTSEKIQLAGVVGIFMQSKAAIIAAQA